MVLIDQITITRMFKLTDANKATKAFFDILVGGAILIKDLRLVMNSKGELFVAYPQVKNAKKDKYFNGVWIQDVALREHLKEIATKLYASS